MNSKSLLRIEYGPKINSVGKAQIYELAKSISNLIGDKSDQSYSCNICIGFSSSEISYKLHEFLSDFPATANRDYVIIISSSCDGLTSIS